MILKSLAIQKDVLLYQDINQRKHVGISTESVQKLLN